jgi:hypothetical protein
MYSAASKLKGFYVYAYLRANDGTPYYIGKGKGERAFHPYHRYVATPKDIKHIQFLGTGMNEPDALQAEMLLIAFYGRKDCGTGILRNLTDGGEGLSGYFTPESERIKRSERMKGRIRTPEHCRNISIGKKGRIPSEIERLHISEATKGKKFSQETRNRISEAKRGVPIPKLCGSGNPRAKVTDDNVRMIRAGLVTRRQAFDMWTLSFSQYYRLKKGEQWSLPQV